MTRYFYICIILFSFTVTGQKLTGKQLLNKAIEYHDPHNNWDSFKGQLYITMVTPNTSKRHSKISIDLPNAYFSSVVTKGENTITSIIEKGDCSFTLNGSPNITQNKKDSLSRPKIG
ncbi:DUF6503 family protein [uncultured Maribacter sp.]|uniref:DUF6503 family protein n=1 Tax=uncultured Maribacter sp. TaxID=431308 RepID=UPI002605242D|nr:DUF6503 family protein [uncultured Maribacter sp.]